MPVGGHYFAEVQQLHESIVAMGNTAGDLLGQSIAAFTASDTVLAREVIERDNELDDLEDEHEEKTIQIMALNQPVARDLRLLVAFMRTNAAIERTGDLSVNIAKTTLRLADKPRIKPYVDIPMEYEAVRSLWDDVIRAFATTDEEVPSGIRERDDEIDQLNESTIRQLVTIGMDHPDQIYQATNIIGVSKALERVGDLAVDIADEIVFANSGTLRHHRTAPYRQQKVESA